MGWCYMFYVPLRKECKFKQKKSPNRTFFCCDCLFFLNIHPRSKGNLRLLDNRAKSLP